MLTKTVRKVLDYINVDPNEDRSTTDDTLGGSIRLVSGNVDLDTTLMIVVRICLLAIALLTATVYSFYFNKGHGSAVHMLYTPIALLFGFCALSGFWILSRKTGVAFMYLQFLADIAFITAVIYITGGPISPFLFLYLPLIMGAAILTSQHAALLVAAVSVLSYTTLVGLMVNGWILPLDASSTVATPTQGVLVQILGLASALVLIAVATNFLRRRLKLGEFIVAQSREDLRALSNQQQILVNEIPNGVITTNLEDCITNINQAASALLEVQESQAVGQKLPHLLKDLFPDAQFQLSHVKDRVGHQEVEIKQRGSHLPTKLIYSTKKIVDDNGAEAGTIYVLQDITKLRSIEEQLALQERMAKLLANRSGSTDNIKDSPLEEFVGESQLMQKVFSLIKRVAPSDASVLITGESGTGKELVAKAIHNCGPRANYPFIAVNCGAVPENLIESELFGHKKGSFTGANADQIGLFQQAEGGTIFLDEIGELPLQMQSKLLRALQEKTIRPIGGDKELQINVRVISATNRNLRSEVDKVTFREDLFYRLNVISISLPPLKNRKEDIPLLVNAILKKLVNEDVTPVVPPATMQILMNYHYRGNVRELENILERALVLGGEVILPEHLPDHMRTPTAPQSNRSTTETEIIVDENLQFPIKLDELLASIEKRYLEAALQETSGAKKKAAELLGMNFRSFRYRLQKFEIE